MPRISTVDRFYVDPQKIRQTALRRKYIEVEGIDGWRTRPFLPRKIRSRIETRFALEIRDWCSDPDDLSHANGSFFIALEKGKRAEKVYVHADDPVTWMTLLVYLTPDAPADSGTSFWEHKETGLKHWPAPADAKRRGTSVDRLRALLDRDAAVRSKWRAVAEVENQFNRAVLFPCAALHSATRHFGTRPAQGRLFQMFRFRAVRGAQRTRGSGRGS